MTGEAKRLGRPHRRAASAVLEAVPGLRPALAKVAGARVQRLFGFWGLWHSFGGLQPLIDSGAIARAGVYTQRNEFREVFGVDVEDFLPDVAAQLRSHVVRDEQG